MRLVAAGVAAVALALPAAASAEDIPVAAAEPTFNEQILLAEPGDTLVLEPGTYFLTEGDALEEKDLTLRGTGESPAETTVIPSGGGEAFDDPGVRTDNLEVGPAQQPAEGTAEDEDDPGAGDISTRAQVIAVIVTLLMFLFVLELVRRRRLVERYALLWLTAALALLVLAIWTDGLEVLGDIMGIEEPANAIFILAFAVAFLLLLNFSVVSSRLSEETKILAQEVASLEEQLGAQKSDDEPPVPAEQPREHA
jgi:hypothetical protein